MCTILQVSAELSLWEDCLRAYHRLLELESKFLDVEILELLVCAVTVCAGNEDCDPPGQCSKGEGGTHMTISLSALQQRDRLGQLLGRITAQGKVPAVVWKLYGDFHLSSHLRLDHVKVSPYACDVM